MKLTHQSLSELLKSYPYPSYERMMYDFKMNYPDGLEINPEMKIDLVDRLSVLNRILISIKYDNPKDKTEEDKQEDEKASKEISEEEIKLDKVIEEHRKTEEKMRKEIRLKEAEKEAEEWCRYFKKIL